MSRSFNKIDTNCDVLCLDNGKIASAVVLEFKEHQKLIVVLNKSIKLTLNWNGRKYLGQSSGLEFASDGPNIIVYRIP